MDVHGFPPARPGGSWCPAPGSCRGLGFFSLLCHRQMLPVIWVGPALLHFHGKERKSGKFRRNEAKTLNVSFPCPLPHPSLHTHRVGAWSQGLRCPFGRSGDPSSLVLASVVTQTEAGQMKYYKPPLPPDLVSRTRPSFSAVLMVSRGLDVVL